MKKALAILLMLCMLLSGSSALALYELREPVGEYPLTNEDITLRIMIRQDTLVEDYETNGLTKWIEETTGVKLDFELLPANNAEALNKLSVMFASGQELPDIINFKISLADLAPMASTGAIIPLNDYIGTITPNFDLACETFPQYELKKWATSADGNIYGLPIEAAGVHDYMFKKFIMNKRWLDNLGLEAPTTTDELYNVLKAFKEQDPNGNGIADEYPLVGCVTYDPAIPLMNAFVYEDADQHVVIEDGVIKPVYTTEEWREGLRYLNKLCEEDLLAPITYTQDFAQWRAMANNEGDCIVGAFPYGSQNLIGTASPTYNDFIIVGPFKGPKDVQLACYTRAYATPQWFVTADCKYPELAVKIGDLLYSDTAAIMNRFGLEGEHYTLAKEGDICCFEGFDVIIGQTNAGIDLWSKVQNIYWRNNIPTVVSHLVNSYIWNGDPMNGNYRIGQGASHYYKFRPEEGTYLPMLLYTEDEAFELADYKTTILNYVNESKVRFITGDLDLDKDWDGYLADLESNGLADYMNLLQTVYDRQK